MNNAVKSTELQRSPMSDAVYADFQRITNDWTGIQLSGSKRAMLTNRLTKRLNALGIHSFDEYLSLIKNENSAEKTEFINAVTTNLTYFYREPHHFEFFSNTVLPTVNVRRGGASPIRIWSAGCSYGQEPYTLAMAIRESEITADIRLLCTDIDSDSIESVKAGCYKTEYMRGLSDIQQKRWFVQRTDGYWQASPDLRSMVICKQLNLFDTWPIKPDVDVIMCRNTLIYFNVSAQGKLVKRFADHQDSGGYLFLGHSENVDGIGDFYQRVDNTVYERI